MTDTPAGDAIFCEACGGENHADSRFCRKCGASLAAPAASAPAQTAAPTTGGPTAASDGSLDPAAAESARPAVPEAPAAASIPLGAAAAVSRAPPPTARGPAPGTTWDRLRARPALPLALAALLVLVLLVGLFLLGPGRGLIAPQVTEYANRDLTVASTMDQSAVPLGQVARGGRVSGHWRAAPGGDARWLQIKWGSHGVGYVWGRDLSGQPRPEIAPPDQDYATVQAASLVYAEPDQAAKPIDRLSGGEPARLMGAVANGTWDEVALPAGGVGYVLASDLASGFDPSAPPPPGSGATGVVQYKCQSQDPSVQPAEVSFYLDEARSCINHRYAYYSDDDGGLRRVLLNDGSHRASLLYFSPDRKTFTRTDYSLGASQYANIRKAAMVLDSATCASPGDPRAAQKLQSVLKKATPNLQAKAQNAEWTRKTWTCAAQ